MKKLVFSVLLAYIGLCLSAENSIAGMKNMDKKWRMGTFYGVFTTRNFGETLWRIPGDTEKKQFQSLSVSRKIAFWEEKYLSMEAEGITARHWGRHEEGRQTYQEFVLTVNLRYHKFPWDKYLDTSVAVGEGVSYTTKTPRRERQKDGESQRWLNYLMVELAFDPPFCRDWDVFYRIHHRSGVFKIFSRGGSNFYSLGVRYHFSY